MEPDHRQDKVQRVTLACRPCRARKTKCDGRQPVCLACDSRNARQACIYESRHNKRSNRRHANRESASKRPSQTHPAAQISEIRQEITTGPVREARGKNMDGLATVPLFNESDDHYGTPSSVVFARSLNSGLLNERSESLSATSPLTYPWPDQGTFPADLRRHDDSLAVLPRRSIADELVRCFWDFIHPVFPILHNPTFTAQYNDLWSSTETCQTAQHTVGKTDDIIFMATTNLVFALGSKFSDINAPVSRATVADDFYGRGLRGYSRYILDADSIPVLQFLLLSVVYLQSSRHATRCWNTLGLAIRVAQGLGLHDERSASKQRSHLQQELERRLWHNCVVLDRLLSMTFGRPLGITHSEAVPLPAIIDDEFLRSTDVGSQPLGKLSYMSLFVHSCHLFDLLKEVLKVSETGYAISNASDMSSIDAVIAQTFSLDRKLSQFQDSVPLEIRIDGQQHTPQADRQTVLNLMQQVLYCRYLFIRLLALRPIMMWAMKLSISTEELSIPASPLNDKFMRQTCEQSVDVAQRLVETIYNNLDTPYRSSGWHTVYFTFSAAVTGLAACKSSVTDMTLDSDSFHLLWQQCMVILEAHELQTAASRRAIRELNAIKNRLSSQHSHYQATTYERESCATDPRPDLQEPDHSMAIPPQNLDLAQFDDVYDHDATWLNHWLSDIDWLSESYSLS